MRVLVVENEPGSSIDVVLDLIEAGHRVLRCQPINGEITPCAGLGVAGGCCPLAERIDAVVQVHTGPPSLTQREYGAICASGSGTPIVNVGPGRSWIATVSTTPDELQRTLESVTSGARPVVRARSGWGTASAEG